METALIEFNHMRTDFLAAEAGARRKKKEEELSCRYKRIMIQ